MEILFLDFQGSFLLQQQKLNKVNIISNKIDFQDKFKFSIYSKNHNNSV